MRPDIDSVNQATMAAPSIVKTYERASGLTPPERAALARIAGEAKGRPILDIGVGGGRTVGPLREVSEDYLAIDYAAPMVEAARRLHPGVRFRHADARDLGFLPDQSIFLVVFSFNGLDMVGHSDRLAILREVRRVLTPSGGFLFSTHSLRARELRAGFQIPEIELTLNPARMSMRMLRFARQVLARANNRRRFRGLVEHGDGYSIINDAAHDYGVMIHYIDLPAQRRQLREVGFEGSIEAWDLAGRPTDETCSDDSITFLVRASS